MNKRIRNSQYMVINVLAFLNEKGGVFKDDAQFQSLLGDLQTKVDKLQELESELLMIRLPLSEQKEKLKDEYGRCFQRLGASLNAIAQDLQLDQLQQLLERKNSILLYSGINPSLGYARKLLDAATTYETELEALSRGRETIDQAVLAFDKYEQISGRPGRRRKEAAEVYSEFKALLRECIDFIRIHIIAFFQRWDDVHPSLMNLLEEFSRIPQHGVRYQQDDEESMDAEFDPLNDDELFSEESDLDNSSPNSDHSNDPPAHTGS
jgi:DNA repair exonuclease SbcCD ATPase subunit